MYRKTLTKMNTHVDESMEHVEHFYTISRCVLYSCFGKRRICWGLKYTNAVSTKPHSSVCVQQKGIHIFKKRCTQECSQQHCRSQPKLRDNSNVHQLHINCEIVITVQSHMAKSRSATTTHSNVDALHKLLREKSQIPNGIFIKLQFRTRAKSSGVRSWGSGFFVAWGMVAGDSRCASRFCS